MMSFKESSKRIEKTAVKVCTLGVTLALVLSLAACGLKSKLVGQYEGTAGSYLELYKDGTCYYGEDDETGAGKGTWYIEDKILHIEVEVLGYEVYASVEDMGAGFLLEADTSSWTDEYFIKAKE